MIVGVPKETKRDEYRVALLPVGAEELALCVPVYEEMPGWQESTVGVKQHDKLPKAARDYLKRMGQRPHVATVNADRKTNTEAMLARYA